MRILIFIVSTVLTLSVCQSVGPVTIRGFKDVKILKGKEFLGTDLVVMATDSSQQCLRLCWLYSNCSIATFYQHQQRCRLTNDLPIDIQESSLKNEEAITFDLRSATINKPRLYGCDLRKCEFDELCVPVLDPDSYKCLPLGYKKCPSTPPSVRNSNPTNDGLSKMIYRCKEGYVSSGSNDVTTCDQKSGQWSSVDVTCTFTDCGTPPVVTGASSIGNDSFHEARVVYSCFDGHVSNSSTMSITCQANGEWTAPPNECTLVTCTEPTNVMNGNVKVLERVLMNAPTDDIETDMAMTYGATAVYSCDEGYQSKTTPEFRSECQQDGTWESSSSFICNPRDCGRPPAILNTWNSFNLTTFQAEASYMCIEGYKNNTGSDMKLTCASNGTWLGSEIMCQMVDCWTPPSEKNATVIHSSTTYLSDANYTCDEPTYMYPSPVQTRSCRANGEWSDEAVDCIACGKPREFPHSSFNISSLIKDYYVAKTYCDEGYRMNENERGYVSFMCLPGSNVWLDEVVVCEMISCGDPPQVDNATVVTSNGTSYNSVASYSCNEGYAHAQTNTTSFVCGVDGWNRNTSEIKCGKIVCGIPPSFNNSFYELKNEDETSTTFDFNSTVYYYCLEGFLLTTVSNSKQCLLNGNWDDTPIECEQISCNGKPIEVQNATWTLERTEHGIKAVYHCNDGYQLNNNSDNFVTCVDEMWTDLDEGVQRLCLPVDCGSPPIVNGSSTSLNGTLYNDEVIYSCENGKSWKRICQLDGRWSDENITCIKDGCGPPLSFANTFISSISGTGEADIVTYECETGYQTSTPEFTLSIICGQNNWQINLEGEQNMLNGDLCQVIDCGDPPMILSATADYVKTTFGSVVSYHCQDNYKPIGNVTKECQEDGSWSGDDSFYCLRRKCETPPALQHGSFEVHGNYDIGTIAVYSCDNGYELAYNKSNTTCMFNYSWSETIQCLKLFCGPVPTIDNAEYVLTIVDSVLHALYSCIRGYKISGGDLTLYCSKRENNNRWSGVNIMCEADSCSEPPSVEHAKAELDMKEEESDVKYTCDVGYEHWWFDSKSCRPDTGWSQERVQCNMIDCGNPPEFPNSYKSFEKTTYMSEVVYTCSPGFLFTTSFSKKICTRNGTWSDGLIECTNKMYYCSDPPQEPHSTVSHSSLTILVPKAIYSCDIGYTKYLTKYEKFCYSYQWVGYHRKRCVPMTCSDPPEVTNATVSNNSSNTYGSKVTYTCDDGYQIAGSGSKVCQEDGTWSPEVTECFNISALFCSEPPDVENSIVAITSYVEKAVYSCLPGYIGGGIMRCQDGNWSPLENIKCVPLDCQSPLEFPNTTMTMYKTTVGKRAIYECTNGSENSRPFISYCSAKGQWSLTTNPCEKDEMLKPEIPCPLPFPKISNASTKIIERSGIIFLEHTCNTGFTPSTKSNPFLTYCLGRNWTDITTVCLPVGPCLTIPVAQHSRFISLSKRVASNTQLSFLARYQCDEGYSPRERNEATSSVDASSAICFPENGWGDLPICELVDCGAFPASNDPTNPYKAEKLKTTTYLSKATVTCQPPFMGPLNVSVCQANGEWSKVHMICRIYCDTATPFLGGSLTKQSVNGQNNNTSSWMVNCDTNHTYLGTKDPLTCQLNMTTFEEEWNGFDTSLCARTKWLNPPIPFTTKLPVDKAKYFNKVSVCFDGTYIGKKDESPYISYLMFSTDPPESKSKYKIRIHVSVRTHQAAMDHKLNEDGIRVIIGEQDYRLREKQHVRMCGYIYMSNYTFIGTFNDAFLGKIVYSETTSPTKGALSWAQYVRIDQNLDLNTVEIQYEMIVEDNEISSIGGGIVPGSRLPTL